MGTEARSADTASFARAQRRAAGVAAWAALGSLVPSAITGLVLRSVEQPDARVFELLAGAIGAGLASYFSLRRATRRIDAASRMLEQRIVATTTVARREAESSEHERKMASALAKKTEELQQRLTERALLFDILRDSASTHDLNQVLRGVAERLGPAMRLRELAVLMRDLDRLTIRAAWGFPETTKILGRSMAVGEGLTGHALETGEPVVVPNVALAAPEYLAFWEEVPHTGSFVSIPIRFQNELIGALAMTRPASDPMTPVETAYLKAVADQVALAIRNAQLFAELEARATHDALTNLPNRRLFGERLARAVAEARRYGEPLALLAVDIDHFKALNDREGHAIGDEALVAVSAALQNAVRTTDTVARVGGEEFLVVLARADQKEAAKVAEKLRADVEALELPFATRQPLGRLSISVGVAELTHDDTTSDLVTRADAALYEAKRDGRNRVASIPPIV